MIPDHDIIVNIGVGPMICSDKNIYVAVSEIDLPQSEWEWIENQNQVVRM